MSERSQETRRRLLDAASTEFAALGIAGARVDRIAETARVNKQAIYAYYGSKLDLFDAVYDRMVRGVLEAVPIDGDDLPGYAVALSEFYDRNPDVLRLATWRRLERGDDDLPPVVVDAWAGKIEAIEAAQQRGDLGRDFDARQLLLLVQEIAAIGADGSLERWPDSRPGAIRALRTQLIRDAVARLVRP